jgi:hypothetical protein
MAGWHTASAPARTNRIEGARIAKGKKVMGVKKWSKAHRRKYQKTIAARTRKRKSAKTVDAPQRIVLVIDGQLVPYVRRKKG